jgi:hypothetical protein
MPIDAAFEAEIALALRTIDLLRILLSLNNELALGIGTELLIRTEPHLMALLYVFKHSICFLIYNTPQKVISYHLPTPLLGTL